MQCKDLSDVTILRFLNQEPTRWHTWYWDEKWPPANSVAQVLPRDTPPKVILAKMRTLIRRGLVDGCPCGCRGDYVITPKGIDQLDR